uniref:Uncharacterized protein n=1 Tax=Corethron hystrix TaxID=216773 RepID=A0A7S1G1C7_9STRA|mmetsp:Transcript_9411/g.20862  ORF Transcript_9411/g.20862 Transcript_9411/m.20862 type:complete len:238 (+) Transcript_9411:54-767(+)
MKTFMPFLCIGFLSTSKVNSLNSAFKYSGKLSLRNVFLDGTMVATTKPIRSSGTPDLICIGRRSAAASIISSICFVGSPAFAKTDPRVAEDKKKIVDGYLRLTYLLDNWEKETTVCNRSDNQYIGCERTPEKVMEYLGFKSMNDPLFRADKTLIRLQNLVPDNDSKAQAAFQDALDVFVEKADEGNGMAFISSWGEANPGGGKDRVALFIERSRKDVVDTRESLSTVIRILGLEVNK